MNKEELNRFIRQYTPAERESLESRYPEMVHRHNFEKFQKLDGDTYLFESRIFMKPGDKIVLSRQDRFDKVHPHKHDYIELCYVWSGVSAQTIEGKEVVTKQGDVCIFDTQAVHSIEAAGENDIIVNILMRKEFFDTAFLSRMTKQGIVSEFLVDAVTKNRKNKHYLYFPSHGNPKVQDIVERMLSEYLEGDLGMEEVLESYVIILFTELLRTLRNDSREQENISSEVQILELLAYIEENYEHCTLSDMGKAFGMHGNYLTALLKEKTGRSFLEHVQEQRMKKARMLLENTDIPMAELVPMCGYNNINFFYKKFKESMGCTPAQFRKERKNPLA